MMEYEYLHGTKVSPITPELKVLAETNRIPLSDLATIKKAGNYTDFGMKRVVSKAIALGLSLKTVVMIDMDLKYGSGSSGGNKDRFVQSERTYHGFAE